MEFRWAVFALHLVLFEVSRVTLDSLERTAGVKVRDVAVAAGSRFGTVIYRHWTWIAWLLPVALLGLVTRRNIRQSGRRAASSSVSALLVLHWWSLILLGLFLRGAGDS